MNRLLTILLLAAATTAHGQINNPPTSVNITDATATGRAVLTATNAAAAATAVGLGTANTASFDSLIIGATSGDPLNVDFYQIEASTFSFLFNWEERRLTQGTNNIFTWSSTNATFPVSVSFATNVTVNGNLSVGSLTTTTPSTWALDATQTAAATNGILALPSNANVIRLTNNNAISSVTNGVLGAFYFVVNQATNAVTISNVGGITVQGGTSLTLGANQAATLVATGATNASVANRGDLNNVTLTGVDNLATQQTASSASSLMTRSLSDVRYLGEMWNATQMVPYGTTNIPITVFRLAPMVTYTNGQSQGPYMEEFVSAEKYAGKTVRLLAYCRADSTNGGNVQGALTVRYLTNTAGGPDSEYALTTGGQSHGTLGVYTNLNTDVYPVATSTNQYLIFTSNVGTIPTNAQMIMVSAGFNRASTNTTYTNNLYMHAVQLVVENP